MPPAPRIAILTVSCMKILRMSESSDSRPWYIFGSDGSIEIEAELGNKISNYIQKITRLYLLNELEKILLICVK
jgi:hypothetical protein